MVYTAGSEPVSLKRDCEFKSRPRHLIKDAAYLSIASPHSSTDRASVYETENASSSLAVGV